MQKKMNFNGNSRFSQAALMRQVLKAGLEMGEFPGLNTFKSSITWKKRKFVSNPLVSFNSLIISGCIALASFLIPICLFGFVNIYLSLVLGYSLFLSIFGSLIFFLQPHIRSSLVSWLSTVKDIERISPLRPQACYFWKPDNSNGMGKGDVLFFESDEEIYGMKVYEITEFPSKIEGKFENVVDQLYGARIPFSYWLDIAPLNPDNYKTLFSWRERKKIPKKNLKKHVEIIKNDHAGVWKGAIYFTTMAVQSKFNGIFSDIRAGLWRQVSLQGQRLFAITSSSFRESKVVPFKKPQLIHFIKTAAFPESEHKFLLSGREVINNVFRLSNTIKKSLSHVPNAQFIVPTNLGYDFTPFGTTYDPTWAVSETKVGLLEAHLKGSILISGDHPERRSRIAECLLYNLLKAEKPCIIITKKKRLRDLAKIFPQLLVLRLGQDVSFGFFDTEGIDPEYYATCALKIIETLFPLTPQTLTLLKNKIMDLLHKQVTVGNSTPNTGPSQINQELLNAIHVKDLDIRDAREYQRLHHVFDSWSKGYIASALQNTKIPMKQLVRREPILIEIDEHYYNDHLAASLLLLFKILLTLQDQGLQGFIIYNDVEQVFQGDFRKPCKVFDKIFTLCRHTRTCLVQDLPHASEAFPSHILAHFETIFSTTVRDPFDLKTLLPLLGIDPHNKKQKPRITYLKNLPPAQALLKRPDVLEAFPVFLSIPDLSEHFTDDDLKIRVQNSIAFSPETTQVPQRTALEEYFYVFGMPTEGPQFYFPYLVMKDLHDSLQSRKDGIQTRTNLHPIIIEEILNIGMAVQLIVQAESSNFRFYSLSEQGVKVLTDYMQQNHITE
ncbi:MAG: hypothetical protein ACTSRW_08570 [Candidatus Helarchaeota archaeon]